MKSREGGTAAASPASTSDDANTKTADSEEEEKESAEADSAAAEPAEKTKQKGKKPTKPKFKVAGTPAAAGKGPSSAGGAFPSNSGATSAAGGGLSSAGFSGVNSSGGSAASLAALAVMSAAGGAANGSTTNGWTGSTKTNATGKYADEIQALVDLINEEREKQELKPLTVNTILMKVAQDEARRMFTFVPLQFRTKSVREYVDEAGYSATIITIINAPSSNPLSKVRHVNVSSPAAVVASWMTSAPERAAILNPDFTEIGAGIAEPGPDIPFCAVLFGRPRGENAPAQSDTRTDPTQK
jgi:uncharacterized protein YkwD